MKTVKRSQFGIITLLILAGCTSVPHRGRLFLDSTTHHDDPPAWVSSTRVTWEKEKKYFIRSSHTVRGDERVNGCYDLARLDTKELLLSELANDVRGQIDNAQQSISENAEAILGKVRSGEFEGRITGLRFSEQYFERYFVGDMERIDCHVLSEINEKDYNEIKRNVVHKIANVDPRLKEAITKGQIDFFGQKNRATSSETSTQMATKEPEKQD